LKKIVKLRKRSLLPMAVFREKDIKDREIFPGVVLIQAIEHANGAACVTLGKIVIQPGCELSPHTHPVEDAMIILTGKGIMYGEKEEIPIEGGCHCLVPANTRHGVKNTGDEPMTLIYTWPAIDVSRTLVK
jgi:quercetin dioxygenase-like cupin family protein